MIRKLRHIYSFLRGQRDKRNALKKVKNSVAQKSYYPESDLKSNKEQRRDLKVWAKKYHEYNEFYTLYGFDLQGEGKQDDYIDYLGFMNTRNIVNRIGQVDCQAVLLRDKYLFFKYMKSCKMPVPEVFGVIDNGKYYDVNYNELAEKDICSNVDFFIKESEGECASFVKHISSWDELKLYQDKLQKGKYILQRRVLQAAEMNAIYSSSINTYRIVTINKNGKPYVLTSLLRVGTSTSGNVDNWAAGGLAIGINLQTGRLKKYGFYKPKYGTKVATHPDSKIIFEQTEAPRYKEAVEIALKAAQCLYGIRAIGWDIAITADGPIIIEGNDNWEISLNQACDRPLRKEWEKAIN